jgi:excinuclease ABC subunit C
VKKIVEKLPKSPGVYIFKDAQGEVIYVGKAIRLKDRVKQYFQRTEALGPKTKELVAKIRKIEHKMVESEIEALVLEARLIKKYKPKYNSQLKDDKSYVLIGISKEDLPRIFKTRQNKKELRGDYYGPFPDAGSVHYLLKTIRRIFPYRSCKTLPKKVCLYYHIGLCPGMCEEKISKIEAEEYRQRVGHIKKLLGGRIKSLMTDLRREMKKSAKKEEFEKAEGIRRQMEGLEYVTSGWQRVKNLTDGVELLEDGAEKIEKELLSVLKKDFPKLKKIERIEGFDISNLGRTFVGAMSVWEKGSLTKDQYRKFKVYSKESQDDQFMIREVVYRRLKHPEWPEADIMLVDGGRTQVAAAWQALKIQGKKICVVGLMKKEETLVVKSKDAFREIRLPKQSEGRRVFQLLRDEAHRFANRYRKELKNGRIFHDF